jgi:hypothetical protein
MTLSKTMLYHYADSPCSIFYILNVIWVIVIMLSVVAPYLEDKIWVRMRNTFLNVFLWKF